MFCNTATIDSETEATTRSTPTDRRSADAPPSRGSGRTAATQPVATHTAGAQPPPDQARTAA